MSFIQFAYLYLITVPVFFLIDMVWLGFVAKNFYQSQLSHVMGPVNWPAAIIFYLIFIVGIIIFAVAPALDGGTIGKALLLGVLFGFFTYATYDLTNLATLKDWPLIVVLVDIAWGMVLSGSVAAASFFLAKTFIA